MDEVTMLRKKLERERLARKEAERLLEEKALQLYFSNEKLRQLNADLEKQVAYQSSELRVQQERYRSLIESAEDLMFWMSPGGIFTQVNPVVLRILQKEPSELIGTHYLEIVPEEFKHKVNRLHQRQFERKIHTTYLEFPVLSSSGQQIWLGLRVSLVIKNGEIVELTGLARNITHRVAAEQKLSLLNTRFIALLENLQAAILVEDEHQNVVLVNRKFSDFFDAYLFQKQFQSKQAREFMETIDASYLATPILTSYTQSNSFTTKVLQKELALNDGRILALSLIPIQQGEKSLGRLWFFEDVTDRKHNELKIRRSEEKYRGIMENMELGLLEVDQNGIITRAYDRFCAMTGYTEEELLNQDATKMLLPKEYHGLMHNQNNNRVKGEPGVYEVELIQKSGERKWMLISGAPFYDEMGKVVGSIGIHYDLSDIKRLQGELEEARQEAEKARDAEKDFLANMSHEIRNPINTIVGMTYLMMDTELSEEQLRFLNNIKHTSDILMALVSDILDITKITQGKMDLALREVNLAELINVNAQAMAFRIQEKGVHFEHYIDPELDENLYVDPTILNQILLNLLGNANKFTERGNITLSAICQEKDEKKLRVIIKVADTGIGIPADKLPYIFERFNQAGKATKHKYGGTGLGLSIAKQLVEIHGGVINVQSKVHKGSTFWIDIVFERAGVRAENELPKPSIDLDAKKEQLQLLIVEDNTLNQQYIAGVLQRKGFRYQIANHGREALEILEKDCFDLILMDIRMPEMDGYETTIRLRNMLHNPNHKIPIVALTASALLDEKEKALQTGMNYHLTKPFTPDQIEAVIIQSMKDRAPINGQLEAQVEPGIHPELNQDEINEYYLGDLEHFQMMIGIFNRQTPLQIEEMKSALAEKDWKLMKALAHKMKPSFQMVGLGHIFPIVQDLEQMLESPHNQVDIERQFELLGDQIEKGLHITVAQEALLCLNI
ncbi:MAG: PAS domain S-box protein [Haliscomenobacter sp.]|uniref:PAS domain S-box protein n=1 Tax=Haliscomenobacter sp. TaxID=2717303 RepID=UPI0029AF161A|nr:PAS domain S-box protein [Haliscomenobacter sp.]MDX2068071.1 PAS domain S-box protein [Haliscomenobacter sp.]